MKSILTTMTLLLAIVANLEAGDQPKQGGNAKPQHDPSKATLLQSCDRVLKQLRDWVTDPHDCHSLKQVLHFEMVVAKDSPDKYMTYSSGDLSLTATGSDRVSGVVDEYFSNKVTDLNHDQSFGQIPLLQPFDAHHTRKLDITFNLNNGAIRFTQDGESHVVDSPQCFGEVIFWHTEHKGYLVNWNRTKTSQDPC